MKKETTGWVVATRCHPTNNKPMIAEFSFDSMRSGAIKKFTTVSKEEWPYWRKKFNFKAVKAKVTIEVL